MIYSPQSSQRPQRMIFSITILEKLNATSVNSVFSVVKYLNLKCLLRLGEDCLHPAHLSIGQPDLNAVGMIE
jgi:hypothetical protein